MRLQCQPDLSRRCDAHAFSVSALLLKVTGSLLISGVLVVLYVRDFDVIILALLGIRHVENNRTDLRLAERTRVLVAVSV